MDLDYSHAEISIIPPANTTPAIINTAANAVAPPLTLHTNAGGRLFPAEVPGPRTRSPLRPPLPNLRCSGLGAIPKHDGGWRIIYHLSAPPGLSINNFIDSDSYSLSYCSVDDAYTIINELGTGALFSKIDLKMHFD